MSHDEFWSIWQGYGEIADVLRWTPFDWPPLYFFRLGSLGQPGGYSADCVALLFGSHVPGGYRISLSSHPVLRRRNLGLDRFLFCFGGISHLIYLSSEVRGYSLMFLFLPMTLFFTLRFLDKPSWKNVLLLSLSATASVYTTYAAIFPLVLMVLYVYWRVHGHWHRYDRKVFAAALLTVTLCLPVLFSALSVQFRRVSKTMQFNLPPFPEAYEEIYRFWFGTSTYLLAAMIVFCIFVLLRRRKITRLVLISFIWAFLSVPLLYLVDPYIGMFDINHASWTLIGIPIFVGATLGQLPRWGQYISLGLAALLLLHTPPWQSNYNADLYSQLEVSLKWMQNHWYAGDQILLADDHECTEVAEIWNYALRANQPNGLAFTQTTIGHPRIWFVTADGSPNSPHWGTLRRDFVEREFVGPPGCLFRLYERPPDPEGVLFSNGMRFHGAQFLRDGKALPPGFSPMLHEGETFQVRMWWQVEEPLPQDYSVGTFLMDKERRVIEEVHGPPDPSYPEEAPWETSRWRMGQIYYEDREMEVPYPLERQQLELKLALYHWEEPGVRFVAEGVDTFGMLPVMQIIIDSW